MALSPSGHTCARSPFSGASQSAAIGLVASASPSTWLRLFYGDQYSGYGHLVQWYALAYLIGFLHVPLRVGLYVAESTKAVFAGYATVAVFSLASAYPLIGTFGLNGAMAGPVAAEVIMCVILYTLLRRRLSPAPRPAEHRSVLSAQSALYSECRWRIKKEKKRQQGRDGGAVTQFAPPSRPLACSRDALSSNVRRARITPSEERFEFGAPIFGRSSLLAGGTVSPAHRPGGRRRPAHLRRIAR